MSELVCVSESVYQGGLTRGRRYVVLDTDEEKRQVRVRSDKGRMRWFPNYCFDQSDTLVPLLRAYEIEAGTLLQKIPTEVTVQLSNGERRWCVFATPSSLAECGDWIEGTQIPFHYGNRHIIIANELSENLIDRMLHYIDGQGELLECTLPFESRENEVE